MERPLLVRAVIPHFFSGDTSNSLPAIGEGFGSRRPNSCLERSIAFSRCLHGLINMRRTEQNYFLDLRTALPSLVTNSIQDIVFSDINIEIIVVVYSDFFLSDVVRSIYPLVRLYRSSVSDPRLLGLAARDFLIKHRAPADLNLYLEDDLVIHDQWFPEKISWVAEQSSQRCVLMPHRYELTRKPGSLSKLYIDGSIDHEVLHEWHNPEKSHASGLFQGLINVDFDVPSNPHSGFFALTKKQLLKIRDRSLPVDGFVGPLETAATLTVGKFFTLLKPSDSYFHFFEVEHSHPSFLGYLK